MGVNNSALRRFLSYLIIAMVVVVAIERLRSKLFKYDSSIHSVPKDFILSNWKLINSRPEEYGCNVFVEGAAAVITREVRVDFSAESVKLRGKLVLHRCGKEFLSLAESMPTALSDWKKNSHDFASHIVGGFYIDFIEFLSSPPKMDFDSAGGDRVTILWSAVAKNGNFFSISQKNSVHYGEAHWRAPTDFYATEGMDRGIWLLPAGLNGSWVKNSEGQMSIKLLPNFGSISFTVAEKEVAEIKKEKREELSWRVLSFKNMLNSILSKIGISFPFVLLLAWICRSSSISSQSKRASDEEVLRPVICFSAIFLMVGISEGLLSMASVLYDSRSPWNSFGIASVITLTAFWPVFVARPKEFFCKRGSRLSFWIVVLLSLVLLGASQAMYCKDCGDLVFFRWGNQEAISVNVNRLPSLSAVIMALLIAMTWVGWDLVGHRGAALSAFLTIPTVAVWMFVDQYRSAMEFHAWIFAFLLLVPLGWAAGVITNRWICSAFNLIEPISSALAGFLGVALMAILAMPNLASSSFPDLWSPTALIHMAMWAVLRLWILTSVIYFLLWLKKNEPIGSEINLDHRIAVTCIVLIVFNWNSNNGWLGVLTRIGVAYFLVRYWLLATRTVRWPRRNVASMIARAIADIRLTNEIRRVQRIFLKSIAEKFGKLEIALPEYISRASEIGEYVDARSFRSLHARGHAVLALNRGSLRTPWQRGLSGAIMASLVSFPWVANYILSLWNQTVLLFPANAVIQFTSVIFDLAQWPVLGFLFMYFYPQLRGRNGMQKGFVIGVTLLLPAIFGGLMSENFGKNEWLGVAYWSMQVLICCMTVGVGLGDIAVLRLSGKRWQSLIEIYNIGTLAAWVSTLTLAIAGALTAALAGGASQIVGETLKLVFQK